MYPKEFFSSKPPAPRNGTCFVIMPFEDKFTEVYETIREAVESPEVNFSCTRADDLVGGGHIIQDILRGVSEAEVVIADLTGRNPNVFYELGIVHMVKDIRKVVMLGQDANSIPFDLQDFRMILYKQTIQGARELRTKLIEAVLAVADTNAYRFRMNQGESKEIPYKLMGPDRAIYDLEVIECYFGADSAKFSLKVRRYVAGEGLNVVAADGMGIFKGERRPLPKFPGDIQLESISGNSATFVITKR